MSTGTGIAIGAAVLAFAAVLIYAPAEVGEAVAMASMLLGVAWLATR